MNDLFSCPSCRVLLEQTKVGLTCHSCSKEFPLIQGIPWLFENPEDELASWQNRCHHMLSNIEADIQDLKISRSRDMSALTKDRIESLIQAKREHSKSLEKILAPLKLPEHRNGSIHQAMKSKLPTSVGLLSYYDNIFRDWTWGGEENEASLNLVSRLLPEEVYHGVAIIYGAGSGRFAFDFHRKFSDLRTVAVDINPLMFLTFKRILDGRSTVLYEFPLAPKSMEETSVRHRLKCSDAKNNQLKLVFTDALSPCFADKIADVLITPWFIDIIHHDFKEMAKGMNRQIKLGGKWVNFGSLAFFHRDQSLCYSSDEVELILRASGFKVVNSGRTSVPYLNSPHSSQSRYEEVYTFVAEKTEDADQMKPYAVKPEWLLDANQPIPSLPEFVRTVTANRILSETLSFIDGSRSLNGLASVVAPIVKMNESQARKLLDQVLFDIYQKQLKSRTFQ